MSRGVSDSGTAALDATVRAEPQDEVAAVVGGVVITAHEVDAEIQYNRAASLQEARHDATRALVVRQLLLQRARQTGIAEQKALESPQGQAAIELLLELEVPVPRVEDAACQLYYEANRTRFITPELFSPSHILLEAKPGDTPARAQASGEAEALLHDLKRRPERFEHLASKRSTCPSAKAKGSLGQVTLDDLEPSFADALSRLQPGELCARVVETEHGFHVIRLDARMPSNQLPFDAARERIEIYLRDKAWRQTLHDYIVGLSRSTPIEGFAL